MTTMRHISSWLFLAATVVFMFSAFYVAESKDLWGDEVYGIDHSALGRSSPQLLKKGAPGQGSNSPLFYLLIRLQNKSKPLSDRLGMSPNIFWRSTSVIAMVLSALYIWMAFRKTILPPTLAASVAGALLFSRFTFDYAMEARPYALWVLTTALILSGALSGYRSRWWILPFVWLGFTVNASIFQMSVMGLTSMITCRVLHKPFREFHSFWIGIVIGGSVAFYYSLLTLRGAPFGYTDTAWGTWPDLLRFMGHYIPLVAGSITVGILAYRRQDTEWLFLSLTGIGWYFMAIPMFYFTREKGFFFTERQYIFWIVILVFNLAGLLTYLLQAWNDSRSEHRITQAWLFLMLLMTLWRMDIHKVLLRIANSWIG